MIHKGPLVRKRPRKRNRDGTWRKKRSDAGKKREKTMSNNARDTQFQGFAKALWDELSNNDTDNEPWDIIARRAYGLAKHAMSHVGQGMAAENEGGPTYLEENMRYIPDLMIIPGLMTELPKEQEATPNIQIDRLDGSCPVQSTGIIDDHSAFYFRGRHEKWQFVAGPKELSTDDLVKAQLKMTTDDRVFVLKGDDDERLYQDYDHVRSVLPAYAQQYIEWMSERKEQDERQ